MTAWASGSPNPAPGTVTFGAHSDLTFGPGASNGGWDQFERNEKLFGVKTSFDEEVYTKLDWNGPDFKERERRVQQIANEIMDVSYIFLVYHTFSCLVFSQSSTNNAHVREERMMDNAGENGMNEEKK